MSNATQGQASWIYRKVLSHPLLDAFLKHQVGEVERVHVGWGMRPSGRAAIRKTNRTGGKLLLLEDAFVRSLRPGNHGAVYGVIADSQGIHYSADGKSDLIRALETGTPTGWMQAHPEDRLTEEVIRKFIESGASKYNWFAGEFKDDPLPDRVGTLVVDQSRGDAAIRYGGLRVETFDRMLREALDQTSGEPIYVRSHPDHVFRKKHSCFSEKLLDDSRVVLLSPDLSPAQCFSFCPTVVVASSLMGMEALIHGKKVITYGRPFYAGWGQTDDRGDVTRTHRLGLTALFKAAYLEYGHYFDPDSQEPCGLSTILDHLILQKNLFQKNVGLSVTVGFSPWKRTIVESYLASPAGSLAQVSNFSDVGRLAGPPPESFLVWGRKAEFPVEYQTRTRRIEDGFIRSKGLGAAFNFPYSWVVDSRGIYFDPQRPSDLEDLLNHGFTAVELGEATRLLGLLRDKRLTKYNLTGKEVQLNREEIGNRKIILVPGQVEQDASIIFGSPEVKSNSELLRRVREAEPEAFIIFKAHPDLVAGTRHGNVLPEGIPTQADLSVTEGNVLDWLDVCDEVHTMTSTVGFEALIRNVPVTTYGLPFYAGWGLTTDRLRCTRRCRKLTVEELVCGALIRYPRYLNPATGEFTTALKAAQLLTSTEVAGDRRAWNLKLISVLKNWWVRAVRTNGFCE